MLLTCRKLCCNSYSISNFKPQHQHGKLDAAHNFQIRKISSAVSWTVACHCALTSIGVVVTCASP